MSLVVHHKHYLGAAHSFEIITPADPVAGQYIRPDVTILKTFFINDKVNVNDWQATWEGLKEDAQELPGIPLVLQEDLQHPKFSVQEMFDRGTIFDYDIDEENHQIIVYVRITDPKIVERIKSGELQYVSPAVIPRGSETLTNENGVDILHRTLPLHLCIVGDPAYGKDVAKMTHLCSGDGTECYHRLKMMTAASRVDKIIKREHQLLDKGIPETKVHEMLKNEFGADLQDCVSNKIPILKEEHKEWADDKVQAVAFSMCRRGEANIMDPLTQTPLIKKMLGTTARIASILLKIKTGSAYHIHDGKEGHWINVQNMDVFVARNQSIKEAMLEQCGCASIAATKHSKESVNYHKTENKEINCKSCKFFNPEQKSCDVVEGDISEYFISDLYQPKE